MRRGVLGFAGVVIWALCGVAGAAAVELSRDEAIGQKFGAPGPRVCSTLSETQDGVLTDALATAYVICNIEQDYQGDGEELDLLGDVQVHIVAARPFDDDAFDDIDHAATVYEIAGSSTRYACVLPGGTLPAEQQCTKTPNPNDAGLCYQNLSGEFRCSWSDYYAPISSDTRLRVPAPTLAEVE